MSQDEETAATQRVALGMASALATMAPFLEMVDGLLAQTRQRGFTDDQARAIVATMFGWRPTPDAPEVDE